jgi:hypothetical protein
MWSSSAPASAVSHPPALQRLLAVAAALLPPQFAIACQQACNGLDVSTFRTSHLPLRVAGLCCAALLARYGFRVTVCESHYLAGGAAHSFDIQGYSFDAGPSFFAGISGAAQQGAFGGFFRCVPPAGNPL